MYPTLVTQINSNLFHRLNHSANISFAFHILSFSNSIRSEKSTTSVFVLVEEEEKKEEVHEDTTQLFLYNSPNTLNQNTSLLLWRLQPINQSISFYHRHVTLSTLHQTAARHFHLPANIQHGFLPNKYTTQLLSGLTNVAS